MTIKPSGITCSPCGKEIDLEDGPIRMVGSPKSFPFCWECFQVLYRSGYMEQCDIFAEEGKDGRLYIKMDPGKGC